MAIFRNGGMPQATNPLQQMMSNLGQYGPMLSQYLQQMQSMSPTGIQAGTAPMALGAAQQLQQGITPMERAAASQGIARQLNSALGQIAGGGATGESFRAQAGTQALPGFAQALGGLQAQDEAVRRAGAESVFSQLASSLLGPDPMQEAFGSLVARVNSSPGMSQASQMPQRYFGVNKTGRAGY